MKESKNTNNEEIYIKNDTSTGRIDSRIEIDVNNAWLLLSRKTHNILS